MKPYFTRFVVGQSIRNLIPSGVTAMNEMNNNVNDELDCRGLACPQPVARCRDLLKNTAPASLEVIVDNQAAVENVSRFLQNNGYAATVRQTGGAEWRISAAKTGDSAKNTEAAYTYAPEHGDAKTLVLITTETLGRGDDVLGSKLMDTFLGSLLELGPALWCIILLNGGVKLAANSGPALEQLKKLAAAGVRILVCGTCLMHYGLLEQKQVGETTNMMDVVNSLSLAQKIIRP